MNQHATTTQSIKLKVYSLKELAGLYECSGKTMKKLLAPLEKETGPKIGRVYTPRQMKIIFTELGIPGTMHLN